MKNKIRNRIEKLEFQKEILLNLANGYSYKEIQKKFNLTDYEIRFCAKFLYEKYNATNKISLVYQAICSKDIDITKIRSWTNCSTSK